MLATVESARRQGLARRLLDTVEAIAQAGGHDLICLVVSDTNAPARASPGARSAMWTPQLHASVIVL